MMLERLRGARLPLLTFLAAYAATTVLGATMVLTPAGRSQLGSFLGTPGPPELATIGSPQYYLLLFLPFLLTPLFAFLGIRSTKWAARRLRVVESGLPIGSPRLALGGMAVVAAAYCLYELARHDRLLPSSLLASDTGWQEKAIDRLALWELLGFDFSAIAYAILPTLAACFLARFVLRGRHLLDALGCGVVSLFCCYLYFAMVLKSQFLLLALILAATVVVTRASWVYLPVLAVLSAAAFLGMQLLLGGLTPPAPPTEAAAPEPAHEVSEAQPPAVTSEPETPAENRLPGSEPPIPEVSTTAPAPQPATPGPSARAALGQIGRLMIFRMASGFPFYVEVFSDPEERCGIETNQLPLLPGVRCVLTTKIYREMYPQATWAQGFAPAPAHVSAYGEIGLGYAVLVMALSGLLLGLVGAIGQLGEGPFFSTFNAVGCMFGYYLSQVPLLGALTYGHGLIPYLAPLAVLLVLAIAFRARRAFAGLLPRR